MSEYIIDYELIPLKWRDGYGLSDIDLTEEIVRCCDCKHYYEAENYHPNGNYVRRCCKYFDTYNDEVEPDGYCKWGERK